MPLFNPVSSILDLNIAADVPVTMKDKFRRLGSVMTPTVEGDAVGEPAVLYEDGIWKMWYSGGTFNCKIYYATSLNGTTWEKHGVVIGGGVGGEPDRAGRGCIYKEGGVYYHIHSDLSSDPGGNIRVSTSSDGINFAFAAQIFTNNGEQWANTRIVKDGSTYFLFMDGYENMNWRLYLASSSSITSGWTLLNDGQPLSTPSVSGKLLSSESNSAGSVIENNGIYHMFPWISSEIFYGNTTTNIWYCRSVDKVNWTKPQPLLEIDGETIDGDPIQQFADVWVVNRPEEVRMFYSVVNGVTAGGDIYSALFENDFSHLVGDPQDGTRLGQSVVSPAVPENQQVISYNSDTRQYEPTNGFQAIAISPTDPTATVTITGGGSSPGTDGTYTYRGSVGQDAFTIFGSRTLLRTRGSTWQILAADLTPIYQFTGTSTVDPSGVYSNLGAPGSTGTATVIFNPVEYTEQGFFLSPFEPNFLAPEGSFASRENGSEITLYVNQTGGLPWSPLAISGSVTVIDKDEVDQVIGAGVNTVTWASSIPNPLPEGWHRFTLSISFYATGANRRLQVCIYKNGSLADGVSLSDSISSVDSERGMTLSTPMYADGIDSFDIRIISDGSASIRGQSYLTRLVIERM